MKNTPPVAPKIPHVTEVHGHRLEDDYFWLRERDNPEVMRYLEAENAYTEEMMAPTKAFQEQLYQEILGRIQETDSRPPYPFGDYVYFSRTEKGLQYRIYCRSPRHDASTVETLLDLNQEAVGHKFMALGNYVVSDDGNWLAYSLDTTGYRQYLLHFKDLRSGTLAPERLERVTSVVWSPDHQTVFYTTEDEVTKRSDKFWRHRVGTGESELVYEETDELFGLSCYRSREGRMLFLQSQAMTSSEVRYAPADRPEEWTVFLPRQEDHEYDLDHRGNLFYLRSNRGAVNFQVLTCDQNRPSELSVLIPGSEQVKIEDISLFSDFTVVSLRQDGSEQLQIRPDGGEPYLVPLPEPIHCVFLEVNREFATPCIRYHYQSPITPPTVYQFDLLSRESVILKQDAVLGDYRREDYGCQRLHLPARDGTLVPVSLVYRADQDLTRPQPMLMIGYGSYGLSIDPTFSYSRLSLLQRGVIFAIAHIRGGGEMGEPWRLAGRMEHKMNTFHDFIDCAQELCRRGMTAPDRLAISGGSAGGLLMGVVSNLRPDLFHAVVSDVPFVDVVNTMLDASLPLTTGEYIEWGNPQEKEAFERLLSYSPYDNLKAQAYPSTLVKVSYHDSQVPYWEGAKLVARLRQLQAGPGDILLKSNLDAGHGGASGRYDALREVAFDYAFILGKLSLGPGR